MYYNCVCLYTIWILTDTSYDWLEDVYGERSMAWVKTQNARTMQNRDIEHSGLYQMQILEIVNEY